jgi:hypothetical protein
MIKTYLKWAMYNVGMLALFVLGILLENDGLVYFAVSLYWLQIISALLMSADSISKTILEKIIESDQQLSNRYLNYVWDIGISVMLAYYGFWLTAIFYIVHLLLYKDFYDKYERAIK